MDPLLPGGRLNIKFELNTAIPCKKPISLALDKSWDVSATPFGLLIERIMYIK